MSQIRCEDKDEQAAKHLISPQTQSSVKQHHNLAARVTFSYGLIKLFHCGSSEFNLTDGASR